MSKQTQRLKILPVNKTVVFWSPLDDENVFTRTGTIGEGSCFFHSVLRAYSNEYAGMNRSDRMRFVKRLRASMAGRVDRENWEDIGGGIIAKLPFQENVNNILTNFYKFVSNDSKARGRSTRRVIKSLVGNNPEKLNLYELISTLIPLDKGFEQVILPEAYGKSEGGKIEECCNEVIDGTLKYINNIKEIQYGTAENTAYIVDKTRNFIEKVLQEAQDAAFKAYVKGLQNVATFVDTYTTGLISDRFKRDIYFLDGKTRMPYNNTSTTENIKGRKTILVLWIGGSHYEVIGRLLPGNRIQREFDPDDPLIQKIKTFLMHPERVADEYPDIAAYLPKEFRVDTNDDNDGSDYGSDYDSFDDASEESDKYYDSSDDDSDSYE